MPNAAAAMRQSYTPWFAATGVTDADTAFVRALFETCGMTDEVMREEQMDLMTALTGSGTAFPALLADAMSRYAEAKGLPPAIARRAVTGVMAGAGRMMAADPASPREVVQTYLDYRGTTAAGLQGMIDGRFVDAVHAGLGAAESLAAAWTRQSQQVG
jgi:pyrroline-5-carboxylate reductase